jgi:hypothetical protein
MSDDIEISYSFQLGETDTGASPQAGEKPPAAIENSLFAYATCEVLDLPDGNVLLHSLSSNRQLIVSRDVSIALNYCQEFRTLRDHARFLVSYMPELGGDEAGVQEVISTVKDAGLMLAASQLCERINSASNSSSELPPSNVCIITCDRPAAVERLLESMLQGAGLTRHSRLFLVDDSRDPACAHANREAVETFNLSSPRSMVYVGAEQQESLLQGLISTVPQHEEALRFLTDRSQWSDYKSYGLARTICLLLTVGERCIVMDDDVICSALHSPHKTEGVRFLDNMRDADFYTSIQAWREQTRPAEEEPLAGHARCLGMNLARAIEGLGYGKLQPQDLLGVDVNLFTSLHADAPVIITQCGSLGDPGTGDNSWLWALRADSVGRLLNARGGLASAFINRQYWLGRTNPTFSKLAAMSQVTGVDNSRTLPPYFPVFRGEDLIFGHMINFLYPDSVVLEYDWAVPHLPVEERKGNSQGDSTAARGSFELLARYLSAHRPEDKSVTFETRLEALALLLQQLSEHSSAGLLALFSSELSQLQAGTVKSLSDKIRRPEVQAEDWTAYLSRSLAENVEALQSTGNPREISGVPPQMSEEAILDLIRTYSGRFAGALRAWPAIRAAAPGVVAGLENL